MNTGGTSGANKSGGKNAKKGKITCCEACANYVYDEDYDCYSCMVNLDEDEMARFCPAQTLNVHTISRTTNTGL